MTHNPEVTVRDRDSRDELFVSTRPMTPRQRRFLLIRGLGFAWLITVMGAAWAWTQPSPGPAVWEDGYAREFTGRVVAHPYPMLLVEYPAPGTPRVMLLVEMSKRGGAARAAAFDGHRVTASGYVLRREGRAMIELEGADGALALSGREPPMTTPEARPLGQVTLRGEIVDSKCYLGAMKPGSGRGHKECAMLCIRGGIPPVLVAEGPGGEPYWCLLADSDGSSLGGWVVPFVADAVEVTGDLYELADLRVLRVEPSGVRRLGP